jgi:hypothetical protein
MPQIQLNDQTIAYTIRYSSRAKYVNLRFEPVTGLVVIVPEASQYTDSELDEILHRHSRWILKHHSRQQEAHQQHPPRQYVDGESLPYLGQEYPLAFHYPTEGSRVTVKLQEAGFLIRVPVSHNGQQRLPNIRHALENWYRRTARDYLIPRVAELAESGDFRYQKVFIKNQKTRWGSCSENGNLNFNLRLMMAPPPAIDYIIIHELCHLCELNHSPAFWALLEQHFPDYRHWRQWFKDNTLHLQL